jgi:hypothetical protein
MYLTRPFVSALLFSVGFLLLYMLAGIFGWGPDEESLRSLGEVSRWCERVHTGIFREPVNALSNLGFMVVGILMLYVLAQDPSSEHKDNRFHGLDPIFITYASAVVWLGAGSMLMHGTHTYWGGWADNLGMIMYILLPWLINVGEMGRWSSQRVLVTYAVIVVIYAVARWVFGSGLGVHLDLWSLSIALWAISESLYRFWSPSFRWLSGLVGFVVAAIFGIMPSEMLEQPDRYWWILLFWLPALVSSQSPRSKRSYSPWFFLGVAAFVVAFVIWLRGRPGDPWCDPDSLFQLHGVWHLLSAFATWCIFKFLRTDVPKTA